MTWAADVFTPNFGSIHGRVSEVTGHVWTAQLTSPLDNVGAGQAQVASSIYGTEARLYQGNASNYCNIATVDVPESLGEFATEVGVEIPGQVFQGAGVICRWSSAAWFIATLAKTGAGVWVATLARETVATLSRPALIQEVLGSGWGGFYSWVKVVGRGTTLELWVAEGSVTNVIPAVSKNYVKIGEVVDSTNYGSIKHGVNLYYSSAYTANLNTTGFGLDNFDVSAPPAISAAAPLLRRRQVGV